MKKIMLVSLVVCCSFITSLSFGDMPLMTGGDISSSMKMSMEEGGTQARGSASTYDIRYIMSCFSSVIDSTYIEIKNGVKTEVSNETSSIRHGLSLYFFRNRDDGIFYGNTLKFLLGGCKGKMNGKVKT